LEKILVEFINTLDVSLKNFLDDVGDGTGFSKLTVHQLQYIDAINELGEPSISEIAARLNITKASVTTGINKLLMLGYVTKTQSSEDRRVVNVKLTEAGELLVKAKYQTLKDYGAFIRSALSEDEARIFEETLSRLVKFFHQAS
jgi:DNA-binding MarR family transcriptional regulator